MTADQPLFDRAHADRLTTWAADVLRRQTREKLGAIAEELANEGDAAADAGSKSAIFRATFAELGFYFLLDHIASMDQESKR